MAEMNSAELAEKTRKTLGTMLDYLGLDAELKVEVEPERLAVKITSSEPGRIIGRKGQTLDSLQLLLNRIMFKGDEDCPRISIDIDGYPEAGEHAPGAERAERPERRERRGYDRGERRERRGRGEWRDGAEGRERRSGMSEEQLTELALDAAKEVKKWGEPVTLPKMNAHDRRIIHVTLENDSEVTTASEGDGALKKVVVSLRKEESAPAAAAVEAVAAPESEEVAK